jgi:hypothetical protein
MRRWKLLAALGLAVVVAAGSFLWLRPNPALRITRENCDRIRAGMTRAEVEAILGPPGDYTTGPTTPKPTSPKWDDQDLLPFFVRLGLGDDPEPATYEDWDCDWANITVSFAANGSVVGAVFTPMTRQRRTER